jgi:hypothetical protein
MRGWPKDDEANGQMPRQVIILGGRRLAIGYLLSAIHGAGASPRAAQASGV